ncbi:hypothetical protein BD779DRAFT_1491720 [Infundibulicybe gibba]|nr:hypothetical protein BD779DRAFT_1491720 [Infundibulicybe gibba]
MPVLETASLVVAIGSFLIETPRIATGICSLKPSASELTEKTEARLKEILTEIKDNQMVISRAEIVNILHTHSQHKARLVELRRECPSSFPLTQWWNKRGKHRREIEEFCIIVDEFYAQVMEVSESANTQAILENTQTGTPGKFKLQSPPLTQRCPIPLILVFRNPKSLLYPDSRRPRPRVHGILDLPIPLEWWYPT